MKQNQINNVDKEVKDILNGIKSLEIALKLKKKFIWKNLLKILNLLVIQFQSMLLAAELYGKQVQN